MNTTEVQPAIYVGTYKKYNNGSLYGKWLKLSDYKSADEFLRACYDLHKDERDPELMFQDFEGFPSQYYGEAMSLAELEKLYEWLALEDEDRELIEEYLDATGESMADVDLEEVRERFVTTIGFSRDYVGLAEYYVDEAGIFEIPESIAPYFDYEKYGRDLAIDHYISDNGYVFSAY